MKYLQKAGNWIIPIAAKKGEIMDLFLLNDDVIFSLQLKITFKKKTEQKMMYCFKKYIISVIKLLYFNICFSFC